MTSAPSSADKHGRDLPAGAVAVEERRFGDPLPTERGLAREEDRGGSA